MTYLRKSFWIFLLAGFICPARASDQLPQSSSAQTPPPGPISTIPSDDNDLNLLPQTPMQPSPLSFDLHPDVEQVLPTLNAPSGDQNLLFSSAHVFVKEFRFVGNTVFSSGELHKVVASYEHRDDSSEELEEARQALTAYYVDRGYINSGAVLEDQDVNTGVIEFHLVEGKLTVVNIKGNHWFRTFWLRHELKLAAGDPMNFNGLKQGLQLMRQNPTISQVNAELQPGGNPGESILNAQVKDTQPFQASVVFSNNRPPSVGSDNIQVNLADLNLFGINDPLYLNWGPAHNIGENATDGWQYSGDQNYGGSYMFPFTPWDTMCEIHGEHSDSAIFEQPFDILNITSRLAEYGITIHQPIIRRLNDELTFSIGLEKDYSKTFLLGQPFDVTPGAVNGVSDVTMIPVTLEAVDRSAVHVLSLRSTVNFGLDALGATQDNGPGPDSNFVSWIGQAEYIRTIFDSKAMLVARMNVQLSSEQLLSLEQFSLGGIDSVRGYAENDLLRDNGVFNSIEVRVPVLSRKANDPIITIAPFFDVGTGWNVAKADSFSPTAQTQTLTSLGLGLLVNPTKYINGELYWGYGFERNYVISGNNLQDDGIHFALTISTP